MDVQTPLPLASRCVGIDAFAYPYALAVICFEAHPGECILSPSRTA